jgi:hypothetical protein
VLGLGVLPAAARPPGIYITAQVLITSTGGTTIGLALALKIGRSTTTSRSVILGKRQYALGRRWLLQLGLHNSLGKGPRMCNTARSI